MCVCRLLVVVMLLSIGVARAEVRGRFVRVEAPVSPRMGLHEVEVFSGVRNVVAVDAKAKKTPRVSGTGPKGVDINDRNHVKTLLDGKVEGRGVTLDAVGEVNPWVEFDLGESLPIERVVVKSAGGQYRDRFWRVVSVLDERRRVVWAQAFDLREAQWKNLEWEFVPAAGQSKLSGQTVPEGSHGWVRMSEVLEAPRRPDPADAAARRERFAKRNSPAELKRFAREFFARVDLTQPDLAAARRLVERDDFSGALDAWRDAFLKVVAETTVLNEHEPGRRHYAREADDLAANLLVTLAEGQAIPFQIEPGLIDWGYVAMTASKKSDEPKAEETSLAAARYNVLIHNLPRALLTEYAETGDDKYLAPWAALLDDWGLHLQTDLTRSREDIRDYFVKEPVQHFNFFCFELQLAMKQRPELAKKLPAATLARAMWPVLDEYGPAYWFVCRRAAFNHTFNALNAAYTSGRLLRHFHAGQRLADENRRHWERIFAFNITRDGTMIEIGDEGHLDMHLRIGSLYEQMTKDRPDWFTPQFRARFEESYFQTGRYLVRHMTSNGLGHRYGIGDHFPRLWAATEELCSIGNMIPRPRLSLRPVFAEADSRAIIETVFGRGRDRATLSPARQLAFDEVAKFYGSATKPLAAPRTVSDWMPYAGLHYLRRDWNPDASFMHVLSQPTGGGEANGRNWNTEFRYWDYGVPLLDAAPVRIDGREQNPDSGKQTHHPGSKTERLTAASEQPIPARWHTSPRFDLAETFFEGTYQRLTLHQKLQTLEEEDSPFVTRDARAARTIVQVRPARAFIVAERVVVPGNRARAFDIDYSFWHAGKGNVTADPKSHTLTLLDNARPGVRLHHFAAQPVSYPDSSSSKNARNESKPRTDLFDHSFSAQPAAVQVKSSDGLHLVTLVLPLRDAKDNPVKQVRDLSTSTTTGFTAEFSSGRLTWQTARADRAKLTAGPLTHEAASLMLWEDRADPKQSGGIVLGNDNFEFTLRDNKLTDHIPIRQPLGPPVILPHENVFTDAQPVTIISRTPDAEIHYTLDGSEPTRQSPRYQGPITLRNTTAIRARAFCPGVTEVPFAASGVDASVISHAEFRKRTPLPALTSLNEKQLRSGLKWELMDGSWFQLFSHLGDTVAQASGRSLDRLEACRHVESGHTDMLLDVSMRRNDGPFGVRYSGYLSVPETGTYTFHAPLEFVRPIAEPGYDLRVFLDGEEWNLGQHWHGLGQWSIPLARGPHRLTITFADARTRDKKMPYANLWRGYPAPWVIWRGETPTLELSGPGHHRGPLPNAWLSSQSD